MANLENIILTFTITLLILLGIYYIFTKSGLMVNLNNYLTKDSQKITVINEINEIQRHQDDIHNPYSHYFNPRKYDYHAYSDPLTPPYRRDDYNLPMVGLPTRGYPSRYKKMGTLIDTNDTIPHTDPYKIMFLMGREKYRGSNSYEYYVVEKDSNGILKFDLPSKKYLLNDDDVISVNELGRNYKVKMDSLDTFVYDPYYY